MTVLTFSNPYITRKINNIDKAKLFKKKCDDWTKLYYKILKGLKAIIDVQKQVQDMMKIAKETNTMITKIKDIILKTSITNWVNNVTDILGISKNL